MALCPALAQAAGFALTEHGGRGLGSAWAGEAAIAEDARTIYFNPAGMTELPGTQVVAAINGIRTVGEFDDQGSRLNPAVGGGPLRGGDGGDAGGLNAIPNLYVSHQLLERVWIGLGVDVPFGLKTDWDSDWLGRYHAVLSELQTVNFNPSVAFRPLDQLSFGVGLNVQYAEAELTNAIDLGTVCVVQQGLLPEVCEAVGLPPQGADAFAKVEGDSWAVGWNVGLMWEPREDTRIGLAYRSRVEHDLEGDGDFTIPARTRALVGPTGQLRDTGARAPVEFPDSASLAVFHQVTPRWAVMGDLTWTHWELFEELAVDFENPRQLDLVEREDWSDTLRVALGVRFDPDDRWSLRGGFAYDESAVQSETTRDPRIPDSDRYWVSVGAGYQVTSRMRVDLGYAHIFAPTVSIRTRDVITGHLLRGEVSGGADLVSLQGTLAFN